MNNENGLMKLLRVLLTPVVALYLVIRESAKYLSERAYEGGWGIVNFLVGLAMSAIAAFATSSFALANHVSLLWWGPGAVASFFLTLGIFWPLLILGLFKPLWQLGDKMLALTGKLTKNVAAQIFSGLASLASKLPGAEQLWRNILDEPPGDTPRNRWVVEVLSAVLAIATFAFGVFVAYSSYTYLISAVTTVLWHPLVNQALAGLLALTAATFVLGPLYQLQIEGKEGYLVAALSGSATWLTVSKTGLLAGLSGVSFWAATAMLLVVAFAYIVPGAISLVSGNLIKSILRFWGELLGQVYGDEPNRDFRKFYHHLLNIVIAVLSSGLAYYVALLINLPTALVGVVVVSALLYSYVESLRENLDTYAGNTLIGILLSLVAGFVSFLALPYSGLVGADLADGALAALCVGITFAYGLLIHPFVYLLTRKLTAWASAPLGAKLATIHTSAALAYDRLRDAVRRIQYRAASDNSTYAGLFGHGLSLAVVGLAAWTALPLAVSYLSFGFWISLALVAFVAFNLLAICGRFFYYFGLGAFAYGGGLLTLLLSGHWVYAASGGSVLATLLVAPVVGYLFKSVFAPGFYLVVRSLTNRLFTSWLAPLMSKLFALIWKIFDAFWRQFFRVLVRVEKVCAKIYAAIYKVVAPILRSLYQAIYGVVAPAISAVFKLASSVAKSIATTWQSILDRFGGSK
ncbi:MAG: hypothetical protein Q8T09_01840 [Candidatus Melainabacteria bacterium]|nr:hypothetical protein [Candidatus Melainabacteria bacterium]